MKNRSSLIRLHRFQAEECQRDVAELEAMREDFHRKEKELDQQVLAEQERAGISDVGHYAYPTYAKSMRVRRENLLQSIAGIDIQIEVAKEKLADAFRELKKYELIEEGRRRRVLQEIARLEQQEVDEVGLDMHRQASKT